MLRDTHETRRPVAIWDLPTRLFHWLLAALVCAGWITGQLGAMDMHIRIGESILTLVIFRIAWGFVGSRHSRFGDFLARPRAAWDHLLELIEILRHGPAAARWTNHTGHSALGGWMILLLLLVLLAQAGAGLFATDEIVTDGPLNHLVNSATGHLLTSIHLAGEKLIVVLVAAHVAAALFYLLRKRENLIWPMVDGRKSLPTEAAAGEGRFVSPWLALSLLVAAAALVWAITSL